MRIPKSWVPLMAQRIVDDLTGRNLIRSSIPERELITATEEILLDEFMAEDRLNNEVRSILEGHTSDIDQKGLDYKKLFDLTKRKLLKERDIVL